MKITNIKKFVLLNETDAIFIGRLCYQIKTKIIKR